MKNKFIVFGSFLLLLPHHAHAAPGSPQSERTEPGGIYEAPNFIPPFFQAESDNILGGLAGGDYSIIHSTLQSVNDRIEKGTLAQPVFFLMGIIAYKEARYPDALDHLQKAHASGFALRPYISYWIGKTLNTMGRSADAVQWLSPPQKIGRRIDEDTFWERVNALMSISKWEEAEALLARRKKETPKDEYTQLKIKFIQGKMAVLKAQRTTAHKIWKEILIQWAGSPFEDEITDILEKEGLSLEAFLSQNELLARAKKLRESGQPFEAIALYEKIARSGKDVSLETAFAQFKARQYKKSASLFQELMDHPKSGHNRAEILEKLATSYGRSDQFDQALLYNRKIIQLYPHSNSAKTARYKVAFIYLDSGQYAKAAQAFTEYLGREGGYKRKEAVWNRLWAVYLTGNYSQTLMELEALEKKERDKGELLKIAYWKARSLEQMRRTDSAQTIYREIVRQKPNHYYAFLSLQRLKKNGLDSYTLVDPLTIEHLPKCEPGDNENNWVNTIPLSDPLAVAVSLAQIGLSEYAYDEAERSEILKGSLPLVDLTSALETAQNYKRICAMGRAFLKIRPSGGKEPRYWAMAYPLAYFQWVDIFSERLNLDKYLTWSVMREESAFRPSVVSKAYAIGLMQMIPQTGKEVASLLGKTGFRPEDLKDPMTNIEFGMHYLKNRLDEFEGKMIYALASYNAGPDAVNRWRRWGDKLSPDEFVELIPYDETRDYVKKVMTSYWIYRGLYE
ncbi:MAG: transglycosylase SLT domain-containing protein [Deltaproteobacteria bacterium]|nr:transglycosylase SLT domain-containing protein [Deltaproteobacteria bacterium]